MDSPVPTLDHVVVNARDSLDQAAELYRRLGFTLTPRGYHTLGSMNHLAIFGTDYLELIAARPGDRTRAEILEAPLGLNGIVFGTEDSAAVHAALRAAGAAVEPPNEFSRPVELEGGARRDAVFRTVRLAQQIIPGGRLYFCHHFTRDLVWRDEWRRHPNGAVAVVRAVVAAEDPPAVTAYFRTLFGADAVRSEAVLAMGAASVEIITPAALRAQFGAAAPDGGGRSAFMAALTFRTLSLDRAVAALRSGGIAPLEQGERVLIAAADAFGAALEFRE